MDPLGVGDVLATLRAIHSLLQQMNAMVDVGHRVHELLWSGGNDWLAAEQFVTATTNRGTSRDFLTDSTIGQVLPTTTRIANAGLTLAAIYASGRLMWSHGMFTHYTLRTMLPRLLLAVFLVNYCGPLFQAAVDMNNALAHEALSTTGRTIDLGHTFKSWADDAWASPGLGPAVGLALIIGYLVLGLAYIVRYALLVLLVALAPLAALMTVLEETQKYAREWVSLTVTTLLMQPLQLFVLGLGVSFEAGVGATSPLRHGFALACLWMTFKVPGALHAAGSAGSHAMSAGKHLAHQATRHHAEHRVASHVPHPAPRGAGATAAVRAAIL